MTAKEKQTEFIKSYLKPTLKQFGYQTSGQTWWRDKGDFFNVINLQNYSWNSKDKVDFRFNIGVALKVTLRDKQKKKAGYNDLNTHLDEGAFLPHRAKRKFGNYQGYSMTDDTDLSEFTKELRTDFETYILPTIEQLQSLGDCVKFHERFPICGDNLKLLIKNHQLNLI